MHSIPRNGVQELAIVVANIRGKNRDQIHILTPTISSLDGYRYKKVLVLKNRSMVASEHQRSHRALEKCSLHPEGHDDNNFRIRVRGRPAEVIRGAPPQTTG